MSPEIVSGKEYSGFASDVWALGVVLYVLLCGRFPFKANTEHELYHKIRRGSFQLPDTFVSNTGKRVIKGILRVDQGSRPSVSQILNHEWVSHLDTNVPLGSMSNNQSSRTMHANNQAKVLSEQIATNNAFLEARLTRPQTAGPTPSSSSSDLDRRRHFVTTTHQVGGVGVTSHAYQGAGSDSLSFTAGASASASASSTTNDQNTLDADSALDTVDTPRFQARKAALQGGGGGFGVAAVAAAADGKGGAGGGAADGLEEDPLEANNFDTAGVYEDDGGESSYEIENLEGLPEGDKRKERRRPSTSTGLYGAGRKAELGASTGNLNFVS